MPSAADPEKEQREQAQVKAAANLRRLDRGPDSASNGDVAARDGAPRAPRKEDLELNQYESQIAMEVVAPEDISVNFEGEWAAGRWCCGRTADSLQILEG